MFNIFKHILIYLFVITTTAFGHTPPPTFNIDDDKTAINIEAEIDKYPTQIRLNLLYKLAKYYYSTNPEKTILFTDQAIEEIKKLNSSKYETLQMYCEVLKGNTFSKQGFEYLAGKAYFNAVLITSDETQPSIKFNNLTLLGNSLYKQKNYFQSLKFSKKALEAAKIIGNEESITNTLLRIAGTYINLNYNDSSKAIINSILASNPDSSLSSRCYINLSEIDLLESNFDNAVVNINKSLSYAQNNNRTHIEDRCNAQFAKLYTIKHDYILARDYINKCSRDYYHLGNDIDKLVASGLIFEKTENYQKATEFYKQLTNVTDSLLQIQESLSNEIFSTQLKMLEKEKELNKLKVSKYQIESNVKKTRFLILVSLTLILFLIISTYLIINFQREKNKNLQIISAQKEELTLKKHKEDIRKMELKTAIAQLQGQEIERERLAKELHDGVGGTLAGIKMELESVFSTLAKKKDLSYILKNLNNTYLEVRSISKNLSLPNFISESLNDNILELIQFFPGKNNLKINFNTFPSDNWDDLDFQTQKELYRIIQEAITNVIKHAKASELDIQIVNDQSTLTLYIEDNGIGFDMSKTWSGIGLKNLYSRANVLKGELIIESAPEEGTSLNLNIPLIK